MRRSSSSGSDGGGRQRRASRSLLRSTQPSRAGCSAEEAADRRAAAEAARPGQRAAALLRVTNHGDASPNRSARARRRRITRRSSPTPRRTTTPRATCPRRVAGPACRAMGLDGRGATRSSSRGSPRASIRRPASNLCGIRRRVNTTNERGETVRTMEHRAGWDATFSAPKSVSRSRRLVGGDDRVREAHRESVTVALDEMEKYVQARIGGNIPAQTTGAWAVAKFEHDSSRPVDGYAAPQLHTHAVFFNVTETADGEHAGVAAAGALQDAAVRDGGVSFGAGGAVAGHGLRDRARASMGSRRSRATRASIWRHRVRGGSRSKSTWRSRAAAAPRPRRSRRIRRAMRSSRSRTMRSRAQHQEMAREHGNQPQRVLAEAAQRPGVELRPESSQDRRA